MLSKIYPSLGVLEINGGVCPVARSEATRSENVPIGHT